MQTPKTDNYNTGQLFLHKVFGYRGVILFPWTARGNYHVTHSFVMLIKFTHLIVYDRDVANQKSDDENSITSPNNDNTKEVQKRTQTFYQVLIDSRDIPFIRAQTEAVTFLGSNQENSDIS